MSNTPEKIQSALLKKYHKEADTLFKQDKFDDALIISEKAISIAHRLAKTKDSTLIEIIKLTSLCHFHKGQNAIGLQYMEEALAIGIEIFGESHERTLGTYIGLAGFYITSLQLEKALDYLQKVTRLKPTINDTPSIQSGYFFIQMGLCYSKMEDFGRAIPYFQKTLKILESLDDDPGNFEYMCYHRIGDCYDSLGHKSKALESYQKALEAELKFNVGDSQRLSACYYNLADGYFQLERYEEAIENHKQSLRIEIKISGQDSLQTSFPYSGLGQIYLVLNDLEQAEEYLQKALSISLNFSENQEVNIAYSFSYLCHLFFRKKEYQQALEYAQKGLRILTKNKHLGDVYQQPLLQDLGESSGLALLTRKASAFYGYYLAEGLPKHLQAAWESVDLAIQLLEKIRKGHRSDHSKLSILQKYLKSFQVGTEIIHSIWTNTQEKATEEKAFDLIERAKAVLLLSSMQEGIAKTNALIPADLLQKEKELRKQLGLLEKAIQQKEAEQVEESQVSAKEIEIRSLQVDYLESQQTYLQLMEELEANYPDYFQLKYETQTASILQIQTLLQAGELLIQYSLYKEVLFIFAISPNSVSFKKLTPSKDLAQIIEDFEKTMFLSDLETYSDLAAQLYEQLLAPIEAELKGKNKLLIIPDGHLHRLSFDALLLPFQVPIEEFSELPYLIKNFDIQYHYSATLFWYAHQKKANKKESLKDGFLGLAPIKFDKTTTESSGYMLKSGKKGRKLILKSGGNEEEALLDLAETETEVKTVYELFEGQDKEAIALFYDMASKENLLEYIEEYKYVLLSTHGFSDSEYTALSGLNLYAESGRVDLEQGKLYISDVMNLDLHADLVVLSSCESGVGKLQQGEGMMALHRAFLYAGASNIVYSLFKVPQDSTSELVQTFFWHVLEGDSYSAALRKAKLGLIENEVMEPIDWAGFALIGG